MHNKKVCFVIQRYGEKVNGGAEQHCLFSCREEWLSSVTWKFLQLRQGLHDLEK